MAACCGLDWASEHHDLRIADTQTGELLVERRVAHDKAGIDELLGLLAEHDVERVAIERPDGLLVGRLLAAGRTVLAIHPNQVKAARPRFQVAGGKSDRFDAMVLCELARTDSHRLPALHPSGDETLALKALVRAREDLVAVRIELANRLRAELERAWPAAAHLFAAVDSPIALAFLERFPSAADARGLSPKRLKTFLERHRYPGRRAPEELLARLHAAPTAAIGELEADARRQIVLGLLAALRPVVEQVGLLTGQITGAVATHPDGHIFRSLFKRPDVSITAAGLLAEIGDARARYPTADALAADAGMTPVAIESGKRKAAAFRRGCDHRLRQHFCTLANATRLWHPWANDIYTRARQRGHDHPRAIRTLGRAWARVLWRCWHDYTAYDPARHGNFQRLLNERA